MGNIFFELTIIICFAAFVTIIFRFLKQPPVLAYILTGILIGPFGQFHLQSQEGLSSLAQFGITLLLFMLGLELKLKELKSIGAVASTIGVAQIVLTALIGFFIGLFLGFSQLTSLYIGIACSFSSTIVIVKLLSDKKDLTSLYGKISIAILLVQDFCAMFLLMILSGFQKDAGNISSLNLFGAVLVKAVVLFGIVLYLSRRIFPLIMHKIAHSQETLFLFALAWVFGFASFVHSSIIGFPIEIGGFLAGIALAHSSENFQIIARTRSLRDFFITIFFVSLGMEMTFSNAQTIIIPVLLLSLFVLVGKPLLTMSIMGLVGYKKRTSFLTGLTTGQISEFSLILMFLGLKLGHVSNEVLSLFTFVGIITFAVSTYAIINGNNLYKIFHTYLSFLEKKRTRENKNDSTQNELESLQDHVVLVGAHRMGESILDALQEEKEKVIVIDFDPDIVLAVRNKGVLSLFGDIADIDIHERSEIHKAKLVISTVPDLGDNTVLIQSIKHTHHKTKIVVMAQNKEDAKALYTIGADYVILPHLAGGRHLAKIIKEGKLDDLHKLKEKDLS